MSAGPDGAAPAGADPVRALRGLARSFGPAAARAKLRCLERLAQRPRLASARLVELQERILFLLAYPDDARVRTAAEALVPHLARWTATLPARDRRALADTGLAGTAVVDTFGFPLLERLARLHPGSLEVDWDTLADSGPLQLAVARTLLGSEVPGVDDVTMDWDDWLAAARGGGQATDLELLLALFARAPLTPAEREWRFDGSGLPVRWTLPGGAGRAELRWSAPRPAWQRRAPRPRAGSLAASVRRALPLRTLGPEEGERFLDFAARALAVRQSEIRPLSYGNAHDVTLADAGAGLVIALVGVVPHYRESLESLYTALLLKNGVPIAYGPASVSARCCELGLNLFEEFRGLETRHLYAQYMRAIHHALGARAFFLTPYGMGVGNPEALRAGSFWFYRRLGFRPANPAVEALAREEERRLAAAPGTRSSLATLRKLAETSVSFALSRAGIAPLPLGPIGLAVTRAIAVEHGGDRARALAASTRRVTRALGLPRSLPRATLELLAPVLALDPALERRPRAERGRLARFVRAKAAAAERGADAELSAAPGFLAALRAAAAAPAQGTTVVLG